MHYTDEQLPDPPREFFRLIKEVRGRYWIKAARYARPGQPRFAVTRPSSSAVLYASDDLDDVAHYVRTRT